MQNAIFNNRLISFLRFALAIACSLVLWGCSVLVDGTRHPDESGLMKQINVSGLMTLHAVESMPGMTERGVDTIGIVVFEPGVAPVIFKPKVTIMFSDPLTVFDSISIDPGALIKHFLAERSGVQVIDLNADREKIDLFLRKNKWNHKFEFSESEKGKSYLAALKTKGVDAIMVINAQNSVDYLVETNSELPPTGVLYTENDDLLRVFSSFKVDVIDTNTGKSLKNTSYIQAAAQVISKEDLILKDKTALSTDQRNELGQQIQKVYRSNAITTLEMLKVNQ